MADNSAPRSEEVLEYARYLGINPETEPALLWIAETGLGAPLPDGWREHVSPDGYKYYSLHTQVTWQHPLDRSFKELVKEFRERQRKGGEGDEIFEALAARRAMAHAPERGHGHRHSSERERREAPAPAAPAAGGPAWALRMRIGQASRRRMMMGSILLLTVVVLSALLFRDAVTGGGEAEDDESQLSPGGSSGFFSSDFFGGPGGRDAPADPMEFPGPRLYARLLESAGGKTVDVSADSAAAAAAAAGMAGRVPVPAATVEDALREARKAGISLPSGSEPGFNIVLNQVASRGLVAGHLRREAPGYRVLKAAAEKHPKALAIDVGGNHGCYTLYAAALGLSVVVVELQQDLAHVIATAVAVNGAGERVVVLNRAVLDGGDRDITVKPGYIGQDGAIAQALEGAGGDTKSLRLDDVPTGDGPIAFLKVDVEGYELRALESARSLFMQKRVKNVVIEFGPPDRWGRAGSGQTAALALLHSAHGEYGFEIRILPSFCYRNARQALTREAERLDDASGVTYLEVAKGKAEDLLQVMMDARPKDQGECYVWLYLPS